MDAPLHRHLSDLVVRTHRAGSESAALAFATVGEQKDSDRSPGGAFLFQSPIRDGVDGDRTRVAECKELGGPLERRRHLDRRI